MRACPDRSSALALLKKYNAEPFHIQDVYKRQDMLRGLPAVTAAVLADVEGAHRLAQHVRDLFQKLAVDLVFHHCAAPPFVMSTGQPPVVSARIWGRMSCALPRWRMAPSPTTMTSSAREMMRSWWEMMIMVAVPLAWICSKVSVSRAKLQKMCIRDSVGLEGGRLGVLDPLVNHIHQSIDVIGQFDHPSFFSVSSRTRGMMDAGRYFSSGWP